MTVQVPTVHPFLRVPEPEPVHTVPVPMSDERLEQFIGAEYRGLVRTLTLYVGNQHEAEDLAQEAFARVCRDWKRVSMLDEPRLWLRRVAFNLANSQFRRLRSRRRAYTRLESMASLHGAGAAADPADRISVLRALAKLPDRQREVLILRYFEGMSMGEVAELLRCPEGTVKSLASRGVAALRDSGLMVDDDG